MVIKNFEQDYLNETTNVVKQENPGLTVPELYEEYLTFAKTYYGANTLMQIETVFRNTLLPFYKNVNIVDVDETMMMDLQEYLVSQKNKRTGKALSSRQVQKNWDTNKTFISWLCNTGYLPSNPTANIERIKAEKPKMKKWSEKEFRQFIDCFNSTSIYPGIFKLAYYAEMYQNEILALTWDNVDLNEKTITVNKTTSKDGSIQYLKEEKIYKIPEEVEFELLCLKQYAFSDFSFNAYSDEFVFHNGTFEPLPMKTLNTKMKQAFALTNVERLTFNEIRCSRRAN